MKRAAIVVCVVIALATLVYALSGSGTAGTLPIWVTGTQLGNSPITVANGATSVNGALDANQLNLTGVIGQYNGLPSLGNGVTQVISINSGQGFTGDMPFHAAVTVPSTGRTLMRVNYYASITAIGVATSSTMPAGIVQWTDYFTGTTENAYVGYSNSLNTVGAFTQGSLVIMPKPGTIVYYGAFGYQSTPFNQMAYIPNFQIESM